MLWLMFFLSMSTCTSVIKATQTCFWFSVKLKTRNNLEKSNSTLKRTYILYFFCHSLSASLNEMPGRGVVPEQGNENIISDFFAVVTTQVINSRSCFCNVWALLCVRILHDSWFAFPFIIPLGLRQKEMGQGKKPSVSLRKVSKSSLLPNT